jgi:hypothetical protein
MKSLRLKTVEVCGLHAGDNGRSCPFHEYCGQQVRAGDKIVFECCKVTKYDAVTQEEYKENAVKATLLSDDAGIYRKGCTVGFLTKPFLAIYGNATHKRMAEVTELLSESDSATDRKRSYRNCGLCRVVVLE